MKTIFSKHKQLMGDTITPISCFLNLRDAFAGVAIFESSDHTSKSNSKSFICADPMVTIRCEKREIQVREAGRSPQFYPVNNLAHELENHMNNYHFTASDIHALNGFFGVVAYDAIPQFETIQFQPKKRFEALPEVCFSMYRYVVVFDNFTNKIDFIINGFDDDFSEVDTVENLLFHARLYRPDFCVSGIRSSNETDEGFSHKIQRAKEDVKKGEVFQLVLSRSFAQPFSGDDFEVYRQLRVLNPSPYMFYFEFDQARLIGASPEAQFRIDKGIAEIHPIAGTVRRSGNLTKDLKSAKLLESDQKENAEHTMLVDLARNDLNRTCTNVEVKAYKEIQTFSHVIHMVSKVQGQLEEKAVLPAFAAAFPAGTLSGAPKFRAMELIDVYEAENRGYYGGAIGHIAPDGSLNMAIVIRSALSYQNTLFYQAGAGIVLDSVAENEVAEVYNKIGAVAQAIEQASSLKSIKNEYAVN